MACQRCKSERVASAQGKCSDCTGFKVGAVDVHSIYVPGDWGIGGDDYIEFNFCMDCGQIQGSWPLEQTELEANVGACEECGSHEVIVTSKFNEEEGGDVNHHHCRDCDHHWTSW